MLGNEGPFSVGHAVLIVGAEYGVDPLNRRLFIEKVRILDPMTSENLPASQRVEEVGSSRLCFGDAFITF
jgi:hypothetical protein